MSFWDIVWFIVLSFLFFAYLMLLFSILADLFRDSSVSGWTKAIWVLFLLFLPFITALIYLITRGNSMAARAAAQSIQRQEAQNDYIRQVARADTTAQLSDAKKLLDEGAISPEEFAHLKRMVIG
ncbi:SHOCT domain-containing protein [Nocardia sp. NBC_01503]|uniref:SHOCT domain-containing protein n=1 Tax=Nocardia sp. NBC_01503 TaxID=2975997 RepID=UPI002E7BF637|nr:SHOCT domain-containing protein [Nocardia sp. NBC_01503]WTL36045.1 SHOCT domain-containing protein [Nocardia sp. NBC_01503]